MGACDGPAAPAPRGERQLDRLLSYTTFHIGLYSAVFAAAIGYLRPNSGTSYWILIPLGLGCLFLLTAGAAGGAIAGHIAHFEDYGTFMNAQFTPRLLQRVLREGLTYDKWSLIEHRAFWFGIAAIIFAIAASVAVTLALTIATVTH